MNIGWHLAEFSSIVKHQRLHFGMLFHTIFALILLNLILFSHYLLLNSTSSWKLTFFFIPILLSLASLYWTDLLELWYGLFVIHYSFHILHPRSVSSAQLLLILCLSYSVSADKLTGIPLNSCQLHDALKIFLISSHFPFHIFTLHFIFCLSHACCCLNEEKIN